MGTELYEVFSAQLKNSIFIEEIYPDANCGPGRTPGGGGGDTGWAVVGVLTV